MERLQRNGGTAGIVAAALLLVLFFLIGSTGVNLMAPGDPAQTLAAFTQKAGSWMPIGLVGALASAVAAIFLAGLSSRLHDKAPTRSRAVLYFGLIGLSAHALGSLIIWLGGANLVAFAAKDQAAAVPAWIAMTSVLAGLSGAGNGFSGASAAIAGWAIVQTGAMKTVLGWVALAAGVFNILGVFVPTAVPVLLLSFLLAIVWLAWGGIALRAA